MAICNHGLILQPITEEQTIRQLMTFSVVRIKSWKYHKQETRNECRMTGECVTGLNTRTFTILSHGISNITINKYARKKLIKQPKHYTNSSFIFLLNHKKLRKGFQSTKEISGFGGY